MAHKTSPVRVAAFFRALGETGNRTIAAERARVSQSWVTLHRATDPDFPARMAAAVAAARERLRAAASARPDAKWRTQDGEELVVRGTNGRRTQIARARLKQWTPRHRGALSRGAGRVLQRGGGVPGGRDEPGGGVSALSSLAGLRKALGSRRWRRGICGLKWRCSKTAGRAFEPVDYPPDIPIEPMSFDQALSLLKAHQARVHRIGQPRGRSFKPARTSEEAFASLAHKLDRVEKAIRAGTMPGRAGARRDLDRGARIVRGK